METSTIHQADGGREEEWAESLAAQRECESYWSRPPAASRPNTRGVYFYIWHGTCAEQKSHMFKVNCIVSYYIVLKNLYFAESRSKCSLYEWIIKAGSWCSLPAAYFRISNKLSGIQMNSTRLASNTHQWWSRPPTRPVPGVDLLRTDKDLFLQPEANNTTASPATWEVGWARGQRYLLLQPPPPPPPPLLTFYFYKTKATEGAVGGAATCKAHVMSRLPLSLWVRRRGGGRLTGEPHCAVPRAWPRRFEKSGNNRIQGHRKFPFIYLITQLEHNVLKRDVFFLCVSFSTFYF